jgi:hypothetical protein
VVAKMEAGSAVEEPIPQRDKVCLFISHVTHSNSHCQSIVRLSTVRSWTNCLDQCGVGAIQVGRGLDVRNKRPNDAADASGAHSEDVLYQYSCFANMASAVQLGVFSASRLHGENISESMRT